MNKKIKMLRELFLERGELTIRDIQAEFGFKTYYGARLLVDTASMVLPIYETKGKARRFALLNLDEKK